MKTITKKLSIKRNKPMRVTVPYTMDKMCQLTATYTDAKTAIPGKTVNTFFEGHFPGYPVVPGVVLVESMAQVCAASVVANGPAGAKPPLFYLAAVSDVRFLRPVRPGDTLVTRASCGRSRGRNMHSR